MKLEEVQDSNATQLKALWERVQELEKWMSLKWDKKTKKYILVIQD